MTEPIRIGMIGAGKTALWHLRAYHRMKGVSVIGIANQGSPQARKLARKFAIPRYFDDFRKLMDLKGIDAVDICTPTSLHKSMIIAALDRELHVYTEKPFCRNVEEIDEVLNHKRYGKTVVFNGYNLRHCPEFIRIGELIRRGTLGQIRHFSISRTTRALPQSYFFKEGHHGDIFTEFSSHFIDLIDSWGYSDPESVHAVGAQVLPFGTGFDTVQIQLLYPGGTSVHIFNSLAIPGIVPEVTVVGTEKILTLRMGRIRVEAPSVDWSISRLLIRTLRKNWVLPHRILYNPFTASCRHFIECIRKGLNSPYDGYTARRIVAIAEAASRASQKSLESRLE